MPDKADLTIATWNINSVRLRIGLVERFLAEFAPDVLCLQEIKCTDDRFPTGPFRALGYDAVAVNGQRGYHGVATVSRVPFDNVEKRGFCDRGDARHLATTLSPPGAAAPITLHNLYVPAGGEEPDPEVNEKFAHKLAFLDELARCFSDGTGLTAHRMLVGDLNVAPLATDVWSHRQLLHVVSHTPVEVEKLDLARVAGDWIDIVRDHVPPEEKLYTWWSYRARDWRASNRGRRLDHIWVSPPLRARSSGVTVVDAARGWDLPSDHVPVLARFDLGRRPAAA